MFIMDIQELGNNRYRINGEDVYAPNLNVAEDRFVNKYPEYNNDLIAKRKIANGKITKNLVTTAIALGSKGTIRGHKNNSYNQHAHS